MSDKPTRYTERVILAILQRDHVEPAPYYTQETLATTLADALETNAPLARSGLQEEIAALLEQWFAGRGSVNSLAQAIVRMLPLPSVTRHER